MRIKMINRLSLLPPARAGDFTRPSIGQEGTQPCLERDSPSGGGYGSLPGKQLSFGPSRQGVPWTKEVRLRCGPD